MLLSFVMIPLASAFLTAALGRRHKQAGDILANAAGLLLLFFSLNVLSQVHAHKALIYKIGGWGFPVGICLAADGFSALMLVTVNLVSFLVMIYSIAYMERYTEKWKFHTLFLLMLAGMNGVIVAADIFNLYLFLEISSIAGYSLVAFGTESEDLEAAFKYAILGSLASILILLGIALLYSYTSTLAMADISFVLSRKPAGLLIGFISVLFLAGFGMKAALIPFHAWLPDAHSSAPSPVSAALSGVFIKTLGIYAMSRVFFNIIGTSQTFLFTLMVLGIISMSAAAFLAVAQSDIKRMFAYSSISQIGYIFLALGINTPLALLGGLFHLFNHAIFKSLLFLSAGSIEYATGQRSLNKMGGLSKELPVTGWASFIGSMSISGVPPFAGFFSKLMIIFAAIETRHFGFALAASFVSILTLVYYLKFQTLAFLGPRNLGLPRVKEVPLAMRVSLVALAGICVASSLLILPAARPFFKSAADVLANGTTNYQAALLGAFK